MTTLEITIITILGLWQLLYMVGMFTFILNSPNSRPKGFLEIILAIFLFITPIGFAILSIYGYFSDKRSLKKESA